MSESTFLEPHPNIKSLPPQQTIKVREWFSLPSKSNDDASTTLKLMTWNMLAQTLVRRDLFPNSDCLKASQRGGLLPREVLTYNPDIACLQEVDRLEKLLPIFHAAGYSNTYASGPQKLHGCMIMWKSEKYEKVSEQTIFYDEVDLNSILNGNVAEAGEAPQRKATTRVTKNIGLILALSRKDDASKGCIVATTHAFWHPMFTYERARQIGILFNTVRQTQASDPRYRTWPAYLAGDFNTQPTEASYSLLTAQPLTAVHVKSLEHSRVIHISLDPTVPPTPNASNVKEDEGGAAAAASTTTEETKSATGTEEKSNEKKGNEKETDPDRIITNSRRAVPSDDLLSDEELLRLFGCEEGKGLRSGYDEAQRLLSSDSKDGLFGGRVEDATVGLWEPMYTSYTFWWKLTLDYIFILDPLEPADKPEIVGVLKPHTKEDMDPGLPRAGVCGSDHTSLVLEFKRGG
ncbi:hypothetical protein FS837_010582 [Tulasnella sp. UAMH 9824]|nr:hypothetical protein FS837_010582 [Tulasnella sp. UAMH 9824]